MQLIAEPKRKSSREHGALAEAFHKLDEEIHKMEGSIFRHVKSFYAIASDRYKLRVWVTDQLLGWEDLLSEADNNFVSYVQETQQSNKWADKIWLALEVPNSVSVRTPPFLSPLARPFTAPIHLPPLSLVGDWHQGPRGQKDGLPLHLQLRALQPRPRAPRDQHAPKGT